MKVSQTELAKLYNVSKMAVSSWKLKSTIEGVKKIIDTDDPHNAAILATKTKKAHTPPPAAAENLLPPPVSPPQTLNFQQAPKTEIPEFENLSEVSAYREMVKLQKEQASANKTEQAAFFEIEKLKLEIENRKLDIEKQKLQIALETKKQEIQAGMYIATETVQKLIDDTMPMIIAMENEIIDSLNYNDELQGEKVYQLRQIFRRRQKEIADMWETTTTQR